MQYGSFHENCETREQAMGARPTIASEIVMLNRRVRWTGEGIRISPDLRHVKEIIEKLGLEGAILDTNDCVRDATLYRRLVVKLNYLAMDRPDIRYAVSIMGSYASSPKDGQTQESGALSAWATDHLDALPLGREREAIRPHYGTHRQRLGSKSTIQSFNDRRNACPQWRTPQILVKKTEGGVALVVGKCAVRCGVN